MPQIHPYILRKKLFDFYTIHKNTHIIYITYVLTHIIYITHKTVKIFFYNFFNIYKNVNRILPKKQRKVPKKTKLSIQIIIL